MQADGDLDALKQVLNKKTLTHVHGSGSCSALVKLLPGNKELFISHVTWSEYTSMLRIFKLYDFHFSRNGNKGAVDFGNLHLVNFLNYESLTIIINNHHFCFPSVAVKN